MFITLSPKEIRYTQDSISSCFQNGNEIQDLISEIIRGQTTTHEIRTIRVFDKDGKYYSLDNRRLYVFKEVQRLIKSAKFEDKDKFTTRNNGLSIQVRKSKTANRVPKYASPRTTYEASPRTTYEASPRIIYPAGYNLSSLSNRSDGTDDWTLYGLDRTTYEASPRTTYEASPRTTYEASPRIIYPAGYNLSSLSNRSDGTDDWTLYGLDTSRAPNVIREDPIKPKPKKSDDSWCVIL
uniref:Uncharacterized protein n=1 Tax=Octopus bimaculoides TaxID=37653 RepID=A0A0L8FR60_OCTBM